VPRTAVLSAVENDDDKELTLVEAAAIDQSVWVGHASDYDEDGDSDPDEYEVVGDESGFCYYSGSKEDCEDVADQMNEHMPFTGDEAAMKSYKPRRKRGRRGERITPQERLERKRFRKKNRHKLARERKKYYRKNRSQLNRRKEIKERMTTPETKRDKNFHYTYK
jgi:hypothetical protein